MVLDPRLDQLLHENSLRSPRPGRLSAAEFRRQADGIWRSGRHEPIWKVQRLLIAVGGGASQIPLRVYTPAAAGERRRSPVVVYLHGSGWVLNTFQAEEDICAEIANKTGCLVVLVEYRLAPENKFPIPLEDCFAALDWLAGKESAGALRADPERLIVCGESAGANLAAALTLLVRERGGPRLMGQVLIVPPTDRSMDTPSYDEFATGFGAEKEGMRWLWTQYLRSRRDGRNPLASPLRAEDLRGVPPALVITAEYDPLRDEGEAYAARLKEAGVPVRATRYEGMPHAFPLMRGGIVQEAALVEEIAAWIRDRFRSGDP